MEISSAAKHAITIGSTRDRIKLLIYACLWVSFVVDSMVMTPALWGAVFLQPPTPQDP